jgi:hypothetical protein
MGASVVPDRNGVDPSALLARAAADVRHGSRMMERLSQRCRNSQTMNRDSATRLSATRVWIPIGAALFLVALIGSALILPELRLLHLLQALIYVAVVILARNNSMWGVGAGIAIAVFWNGLNLFVTHNMQKGAAAFWSLLQTGRLEEFSGIPMLVLLGGIGHLLIIAGCLAIAFDRRITDKKLWRIVAGGVVALAYLALIVIVARPR